ncbi:MAG: hypothetical protein Q9P90_00085 [candidate division KSB1 bacterium]|nr:hypothetical protein [candidate division KSB1 bacterium]
MKIQGLSGSLQIKANGELRSKHPDERGRTAFAEQLNRANQLRERSGFNRMRPIPIVELKERELGRVLSEKEADYIRRIFDTNPVDLCYNGQCQTEKLGPLGRKIDITA